MKRVVYNLRNINDVGIEQKICDLWVNGKYIKKVEDARNDNVTILYGDTEYCVSLQLYIVLNKRSYDKLIKMAEKLSNIDNRTELTNKVKDELQNFMKKLKIYFNTFMDKELSETILSKLSEEILVSIYLNLSRELEAMGINIFDYITKEDIYDEALINKTIPRGIENSAEFKEVMYQFEEEYSDEDKINENVRRKFSNKKKGKFYYEKVMLLRRILSEEDEQTKQEYIDTLLEIGFNEKDVICLCRNDIIVLETFEKIYNIPQFKEFMIRSVKSMPLKEIMKIYAVVNEEDVLRYINLKKITFEDLKRASKGSSTMNSTVIAIFLRKLYEKEGRIFSEEEVDELLMLGKRTPKDYTRAYYTLITSGMYEDEIKLIDAYEEQIDYENRSSNEEENFLEAVPVQLSDIIIFFNSEKVIEILKKYIENEQNAKSLEQKDDQKRYQEKFVGFYKAIKKIQENEKENKKDLSKNLMDVIKENINDEKEKILIVIKLFKYGIITSEYVSEVIDDNNIDELLELYDDGMGDRVLLGLYYCGVISKENLQVIYEFNEEKLKEENFKTKIENNEISQENLAMMYLIGIIEIDVLVKFVNRNIDWVDVINTLPEVDKIEKLGELYLNKLVTFENLQELKEADIISEKEATAILEKRNVISELKKGLKSEKTKGKSIDRRKKQKETIQNIKGKMELDDKDVLLTKLGYQALTNENDEVLVVAGGSFEGYRVYVNKQYHTILFEGEGASYITHEHQAQNFIKIQEGQESEIEGTRSEWADLASKQRIARRTGDEEAIIKAEGNKTLRRRLHTRNWGENIIQSMVEISTIFMDGSQEEKSAYIRDTSKEIESENKDELEYIRGLFEERKTKGE